MTKTFRTRDPAPCLVSQPHKALLAMQPLGRPVARAAWAHGRRLRLSELTPRASAVARAVGRQQPAPCLRCCVAVYPRLYSTKVPPPPPNSEADAASTEASRASSPDEAASPGTVKASSPLDAASPGAIKTSSPDDDASPDPTKAGRSPPDAASPLSPPDPELPSAVDRRRSALDQRFSHVMDTLQARVLNASHTLNDMTGYSSIDAIKADNESLEAQLAAAQTRVRTARQAYKTSNTKRATTQREVTTLLARKDSWSPADLERFTELYRADHVLEGEVASAQESLTEAEADEQSLSQRLSAGILKRYHEEQIWSDRIRRASTWGTWGLMGMNFVLFVVLQFVAEPWKRKRLVRGVVEQEQAVLQEVRGELAAVKMKLDRMADGGPHLAQATGPEPLDGDETTPRRAAAPLAVDAAAGATWRELLLEPSAWPTLAADLSSERRVSLRMRDASMIAAEAALAGAAFAGAVALMLRRT